MKIFFCKPIFTNETKISLDTYTGYMTILMFSNKWDKVDDLSGSRKVNAEIKIFRTNKKNYIFVDMSCDPWTCSRDPT